MASRDDDVELIKEGLRAVLRAPGTSGKALEAKASAARQLAALDGLVKGRDDAKDDELLEDPMADLEDLERQRQKRARRHIGTLIRRIS